MFSDTLSPYVGFLFRCSLAPDDVRLVGSTVGRADWLVWPRKGRDIPDRMHRLAATDPETALDEAQAYYRSRPDTAGPKREAPPCG